MQLLYSAILVFFSLFTLELHLLKHMQNKLYQTYLEELTP